MKSFTSWIRKREQLLLGTLGIILVIAVWQLISDLRLINPFFISSPSQILKTAFNQTVNGDLLEDFWITVVEFVVAFALSVVLGITIGLLMGLFKRVEYTIDPFLWFLYSTPVIALYPVLIIWLGLGFATVVTLGVLFTITPIIINTFTGVTQTSPVLIKAAKSFGANRRQILFKIALPSAIPMIVTGLRIGVERTLVGVIVGELFSANAGLGFRISYYGARLQVSSLFVAIVLVIILGLILTQSLRLLEKRLLKWQEF